jgi:hypothetical protein
MSRMFSAWTMDIPTRKEIKAQEGCIKEDDYKTRNAYHVHSVAQEQRIITAGNQLAELDTQALDAPTFSLSTGKPGSSATKVNDIDRHSVDRKIVAVGRSPARLKLVLQIS